MKDDNAQLIAAAPDLLYAVQLFLFHAQEPECAIWRSVHNVAISAIEKAIGKNENISKTCLVKQG